MMLIHHTWRHLEADMTGVGMKVFLRIFEQKPEVKDLFPFRDCYGEELSEHSAFRDHAYRFVENLHYRPILAE